MQSIPLSKEIMKAISPVYSNLSKKYPNAEYYKIEVDGVGEVSEEFKVTAVPTFIIFKDGKEVDQIIAPNPSMLEDVIIKHHP